MEGLNLITDNYLGSRSSSSGMVSKRMRKINTMKTISGFVRFATDDSFYLTWSRCFHYHACTPCLSVDTWTGTLVKARSGVSVRRIFNGVVFPTRHSREILELLPGSIRQEFPWMKLLRKLAPSPADLWR